MKFSISQNKKLPPEAQKGLLPREEFLTQGKQRFLAAFDASQLAATGAGASAAPATRPISGWALFFRVGTGALAAIAVAFGVSAYAATAANVSPTNPLYPLKRLVENVQLAVAPARDQAQLQATFAVQRANEIDALQVQNPTSTLIPRLTNDLDTEISSSLTEANQPASSSSSSSVKSGATGAVGIFCGAFVKSTSSVLFGQLESNLVLHPNILTQFNDQCGSDSRRDAGAGRSASASTTVNFVKPTSPGSRGHGHSYGGSGDAATSVGTGAVVAVPGVVLPPVGVTASTTVNATITAPIIGTSPVSSSSSSGGDSHGDDGGADATAGGGADVSVSPAPPIPPVSIPSLGGIL